jgi:hypothetical protein
LHGVCSPFGFLTAYFHEKPVLLSIRHRPSGHAGSFLPYRIWMSDWDRPISRVAATSDTRSRTLL